MINLLLAVILFLFSSSAFAAVAVDTSDYAFADNMDSISFSYTVTGSNTLALCGSAVLGGVMGAATVTFNAVAMTDIDRQNPFGAYEFAAWRMTGVSGTHDFELSIAPEAGFLGLGCVTFTGVDPTTPVGTFATAASPSNINLTVPANGLAWDFAGDFPTDCTDSRVAGAGQTAIFNDCTILSVDAVLILSSYRSTSGDFLWPRYWIQIGVPINPVAAAVSSNRRAIVVQ